MRKLLGVVLALTLVMGLSVPALAAESADTLTIKKTNVQASSVANNGGYGLVAMEIDGRMNSGLIDANGNFLFPYTVNGSDETFEYHYSEGFVTIGYNNEAWYSDESQFYNLDGSIAIDLPDIRDELQAKVEAEYADEHYDSLEVDVKYCVSPFYDGIALVREEYWRYISSAGSGSNYTFHHRAYLMDTQGNVVCELPEEYNEIWGPLRYYFWAEFGQNSDGLIRVVTRGYDWEGMNYKEQIKGCGYMDHSGEIVLDMLDKGYSNCGDFNEGLAWVVETGVGCGFIDRTGTLVIPLQYESVFTFDDGFAAVKKDGKFGAIDTNGNVVIPFMYDDSFGTRDGYMTVGLNGKYGLVDRNNNVAVPIEYDDISIFENGVAYALKDGYVYVITDTPAPIAYARTQTITIDGKAVELQAYALKDENGYETNYVKLRDVAYALNGTSAQFNVGWDGNVNIVTGAAYTPNGTEMSTPFSGDRAYTVPTTSTNVNGVAADLAAIVLTDDNGGGHTYYQLRDLGKALGFHVDWTAERGIFIETEEDKTPLSDEEYATYWAEWEAWLAALDEYEAGFAEERLRYASNPQDKMEFSAYDTPEERAEQTQLLEEKELLEWSQDHDKWAEGIAEAAQAQRKWDAWLTTLDEIEAKYARARLNDVAATWHSYEPAYLGWAENRDEWAKDIAEKAQAEREKLAAEAEAAANTPPSTEKAADGTPLTDEAYAYYSAEWDKWLASLDEATANAARAVFDEQAHGRSLTNGSRETTDEAREATLKDWVDCRETWEQYRIPDKLEQQAKWAQNAANTQNPTVTETKDNNTSGTTSEANKVYSTELCDSALCDYNNEYCQGEDDPNHIDLPYGLERTIIDAWIYQAIPEPTVEAWRENTGLTDDEAWEEYVESLT